MRQKRSGSGLDIRVFNAKDGNSYLVFRTLDGSFHSFVEVEAIEAAEQCGASRRGNTRHMWSGL